MVYLILAIISSSLVSIAMRAGENRAKNNISMLSVNYFICTIFAFLFTGTDGVLQKGGGMTTAIGLGAINGFFYIVSLILFQNSVRRNGVVLSSIFMKLGIMVPLVVSILLFKEMPTKVQIMGFSIAVIAIILINLKGKEQENAEGVTKQQLGNRLGLLLVLIGCGTADGMSKIYQEFGTDRFEELFLVFTFVVALILSVLLVLIKKQRYTGNEILYGALLGVPNYFSARFLLKALGEIPAVIAYPTFSIGTIGVITLTGVIVFKEKLTKLQLFAIVLIAVAVVLLN